MSLQLLGLALFCNIGLAARVRIHLIDGAKEKAVSFRRSPGDRFEIEVPADSLPGDVLRATVGCHEKKITVPDGATPGTILEFDVVDIEKCCPSTSLSDMGFHHEFVIPAGSVPGDTFKVCAKDKEYTIIVPEGGEPGMGLVFRTRQRKRPPPGLPPAPQKTAQEMSLQELLDSRNDELAKAGDLFQFRLEMEIKKRIEQGNAVEDEAEIDDLIDLPAHAEEASVDISAFFGDSKQKKIGHVTYLCCCQGHIAAPNKYIKCEMTLEKEKKQLFGRSGCGGAKGDTWHSFNNMGDKYKEHWYYDRCVVPLSKPVQVVDFTAYPKCLDGVCSPLPL